MFERRYSLKASSCLLVAVVVSCIGVGLSAHPNKELTLAEYQNAARIYVSELLAPDFRDQSRVQRILLGATGTFRDSFAQASDAYSQFVAQTGTVSSGTVDAMGVVATAPVTLLVTAVVKFTRTPVQSKNPASVATNRFRLKLKMEKESDIPKISDLEFYP